FSGEAAWRSRVSAGWRPLRAAGAAGPPRRRPSAPRGSPPRARAGTPSDRTPATFGSGAPNASSSSCRRHPSTRIQSVQRGPGIGVQAGRLLGESLLAFGREPVIATQSTVHDLLAINGDQVVFAKSVERRVQSPGPEPNAPLRDLLDVVDDPVAVLAASSERGEDQERRLLHAPLAHGTNIYRSTDYPSSEARKQLGTNALCQALRARPARAIRTGARDRLELLERAA